MRIEVKSDDDIVTSRTVVKDLAKKLGFGIVDQTKIATAISELTRNVIKYADEGLLRAAMGDKSLQQAINASTLPGLVSHVTVMPDVHQGYGFRVVTDGGCNCFQQAFSQLRIAEFGLVFHSGAKPISSASRRAFRVNCASSSSIFSIAKPAWINT